MIGSGTGIFIPGYAIYFCTVIRHTLTFLQSFALKLKILQTKARCAVLVNHWDPSCSVFSSSSFVASASCCYLLSWLLQLIDLIQFSRLR